MSALRASFSSAAVSRGYSPLDMLARSESVDSLRDSAEPLPRDVKSSGAARREPEAEPLTRLQRSVQIVNDRIAFRQEWLENGGRVAQASSLPQLLKLGGLALAGGVCASAAVALEGSDPGAVISPLLLGCGVALAFAGCAITSRVCVAMARTGCQSVDESDLESQREALQQDQRIAADLNRSISLCQTLHLPEVGPLSIINEYLDDGSESDEPPRLEMSVADAVAQEDSDLEAAAGIGAS